MKNKIKSLLLDNLPNKMELTSKLLEQLAFNTRPKIEEHMLIVMDKSTQGEHLSQPLQTNNKQFKVAVTFLTGYNGIFNVTNSNNKFYFEKTITDEDDFIYITIPPGAYEIESVNNEVKRIIIDKGHYTEVDYPFKIKPKFSTLGSFIEIFPLGPIIGFASEENIRSLLGFHAIILYKEYNLSPNPVDIILFGVIFLECDIAQVMIFKGRRTGFIHSFIMNVNLGYKFIENFRGGLQWYMMDTKDVISSICFKLRNENNEWYHSTVNQYF